MLRGEIESQNDVGEPSASFDHMFLLQLCFMLDTYVLVFQEHLEVGMASIAAPIKMIYYVSAPRLTKKE